MATKQLNPDLEAMKEAVDRDYRTDGLTLPNVPDFQDPENDKFSDIMRKAILEPDKVKGDEVIDKYGTTLDEYRNQLAFGIPPKGAPKASKDAIGKHEFKVHTDSETGIKTVEVIAPEAPEPKVDTTQPSTAIENQSEFTRTPTPSVVTAPISEKDVKADPNPADGK